MIFKFFIFIVCLAQLIIMFNCIIYLISLDKKILKINNYINENKSKIAEIMSLIKGISGQILEFSPLVVDKLNDLKNAFIEKQIKWAMSGILVWYINRKTSNFLKKSKILKAFSKGLSLIQNMI